MNLFRLPFPSTLASALLALATPAALPGHGALHDRIADLAAALANDPRNPALHFTLAEVYSAHGEWEPALALIAEAEALAPGAFPTDLVRGQALLDAGRPDEARAALDRFLAAHPGHAQALVFRARAHTALKKTESALSDYRAAWRENAAAESELAEEVADALAQAGYADDAIQVLVAAIEKFGAIPSLLERALTLELATGRFEAALARVAVLQKVAPRPEPWMARRAETLSRAGRPAEARAAWQALIEHIAALPNLERGQPALRALAEQAQQSLRQTGNAASATPEVPDAAATPGSPSLSPSTSAQRS